MENQINSIIDNLDTGNIVLRPSYQVPVLAKALQKLMMDKFVYLALETRLGKTLISLCAAKAMGCKNIYFFTKKIAMKNIKSDARLVGMSKIVTVMSIDSVHKAIEKTKNERIDCIIIDEAHCIGGFSNGISRRALMLSQLCSVHRGSYIIMLSATPSPESYATLFYQFLIPYCAGHKTAWDDYYSCCRIGQRRMFYRWAGHPNNPNYCKPFKRKFNRVEITDYSNAIKSKVMDDVEKHFISLTQREAGFTFDIAEEIHVVQMSAKTKQYVQELIQKKKLEMPDGSTVSADTQIKELSKVHQLCSGSVIAEKEEDTVYLAIDDSKARYIAQRFQDGKYVIFYKFVSELAILKGTIKDMTTDPSEFQETNVRFIALQIQSGREGVNLSKATGVIYYNIDHAFLSYEQGKNRIQAIDRSRRPSLHWIFSDGGIERKIYKTVLNKKSYTSNYYRYDSGRLFA